MKVRAGNWHGNVIRFDFRPLGLEGWRGTACIVAWGQGQRRGRTAVVLPVRTSATDRCVGSGSYCTIELLGVQDARANPCRVWSVSTGRSGIKVEACHERSRRPKPLRKPGVPSSGHWACMCLSFMQGCPAKCRSVAKPAECLSHKGRCRSRADTLSHAVPPARDGPADRGRVDSHWRLMRVECTPAVSL